MIEVKLLAEESKSDSIASLDGRPVAALLLLYFNRTVEYFAPVIEHEYRSRQPLSFLIWQGMLDAVHRGYPLFLAQQHFRGAVAIWECEFEKPYA